MKAEREKRIRSICPSIPCTSGIYAFYRVDEAGIRRSYVGQAVNLLKRCSSHLAEYDHIALSLKKHGFYSEKNPYGWKLNVMYYPKDQLDEMEQYWILEYTKRGYQCRYNKTAGGQGEGKEKINEFKPSKGYRDGIQQGKKVLARELSAIAEKHLIIRLKPEKEHNKVSQKQYEKFMDLINIGNCEVNNNDD